jgi:hypothetical protein
MAEAASAACPKGSEAGGVRTNPEVSSTEIVKKPLLVKSNRGFFV